MNIINGPKNGIADKLWLVNRHSLWYIIESMCKPLLFFMIFEAALITYNLTQGKINHAIVNMITAGIGSLLIYLLCSIGFDIAAWMLLALVPFFFVALIAFLVITQLISTDVRYWNGPRSGIRESITNKNVRSMFGLPELTGKPTPYYDYTENPAIDDIVDTYNSGGEDHSDHDHS